MFTSSTPCSLAIVNTRIRTGDKSNPWAEAVAIDNGVIVSVGKSKDIAKCVMNSNGKLIDGAREAIALVLPVIWKDVLFPRVFTTATPT